VDKNPILTARRRRRRQERFGSLNPVCVVCGCKEIEKLAATTIEWLSHRVSLFELHHPVGHHHDPDLVVPLCMNCHRAATEGLAQAGVTMNTVYEPNERVALMLDALSTFFELLVTSLRRWAKFLRDGTSKGVER
jgi:hypothetical protein